MEFVRVNILKHRSYPCWWLGGGGVVEGVGEQPLTFTKPVYYEVFPLGNFQSKYKTCLSMLTIDLTTHIN